MRQKMSRTSIGSMIKETRTQKGLTQAQLGKAIWTDISDTAAQARIKRIEANEKYPTYVEMEAMRKVLGGLIQEKSSLEVEEYDHVREIYPEIEAWIKMLCHSHNLHEPPNFELAIAAWRGLEIIAKQKQQIFNKILTTKELKEHVSLQQQNSKAN